MMMMYLTSAKLPTGAFADDSLKADPETIGVAILAITLPRYCQMYYL